MISFWLACDDTGVWWLMLIFAALKWGLWRKWDLYIITCFKSHLSIKERDPLFFSCFSPVDHYICSTWTEENIQGFVEIYWNFYNLNWFFKFRQQHSGYLTDASEFPMAASTHLLFYTVYREAIFYVTGVCRKLLLTEFLKRREKM